MKHFISTFTAAILFLSISACGNNNSKTNMSDSDLTKIDTTLDPADHTDAISSDRSLSRKHERVDTVPALKQDTAQKRGAKK